MITVHTMQVATVAMGGFVMIATSVLATRFWIIRKTLSKAFAYNLAGEFVASFGTTVFSVLQLAGTIDNLKPSWATAIRITMFAAMLASSIHMACVIKRIERER